jgi:hypothetical protein
MRRPSLKYFRRDYRLLPVNVPAAAILFTLFVVMLISRDAHGAFTVGMALFVGMPLVALKWSRRRVDKVPEPDKDSES